MQFLHESDSIKELTYSDIFLVPKRSGVRSRMQVDTAPVDGLGMTVPIIAANMTAVSGRRMAETLARRGGLAVLPQDMSMERVEDIVRFVKTRHPVYETPVVMRAEESIQHALNIIYKRSHGAVIIVDDAMRPIGIFTEKDAKGRDRFMQLGDVMTTELVTIQHGMSPEDMFHLLEDRRLPIAPIVNEEGILIGAMSRKGALRASMYKAAVNQKGELLTSVAVGINRNVPEVVSKLRDMGVDIIVMDTAHGHQERMIEAVRQARETLGPGFPIAAGNIVTADAARDLIEAGATILKVGVGPGAMCTTRMATGVGRPQFSAVKEVADLAKTHAGISVWADGGTKHPRDVALAVAAGADAVMIGSWLSGTYESPADIKFDEQGRKYKENFGMASGRAVRNRNQKTERFEAARRELFKEGISKSRMYLKDGQESAEDIVDQITAGLRSACTYSGAVSLAEFQEKAVVGTQSAAGYNEGKPVSQSW